MVIDPVGASDLRFNRKSFRIYFGGDDYRSVLNDILLCARPFNVG